MKIEIEIIQGITEIGNEKFFKLLIIGSDKRQTSFLIDENKAEALFKNFEMRIQNTLVVEMCDCNRYIIP